MSYDAAVSANASAGVSGDPSGPHGLIFDLGARAAAAGGVGAFVNPALEALVSVNAPIRCFSILHLLYIPAATFDSDYHSFSS